MEFEPARALFVDRDERNVHYEDVLKGLIQGKLLRPGALVVFEVCKENAKPIQRLMLDSGMKNVAIGRDWKNCIRTVEGTYLC